MDLKDFAKKKQKLLEQQKAFEKAAEKAKATKDKMANLKSASSKLDGELKDEE